MEKSLSFITYNPYTNPYMDNSTLKGISYPSFFENKTIHSSSVTNTVSKTAPNNSYNITSMEYGRLQQYIEKELNSSHKDLILA
ncbi:MAG: hypothetical protein GX568_01730 [Candidatus Gastranaerophilales bacterium]|nr:hypothetical protein [Candidatus Gastranaerophilales bacterium]